MLKTRPAETQALPADNDFGCDALGEYKLHPKYLLRVAGESCEFIEDLPVNAASQHCDDLDALVQSLEPQAKALAEALGALVPGVKERAVSHALLARCGAPYSICARRTPTH